MNKKIICTVLFGIFLSGCQSNNMIEEIKEAENIILQENASPLIIDADKVKKAKKNIFTENGYVSVSDVKGLSSENNFLINDKNTIYFKFDSFVLDNESKKNIDKHIDFLTSNIMIKVIVEGHTDERGEKSYNLTLGEKRAKAVKEYMESKGINANRMEIISYGETKPLDMASSEDAWLKNRRTVLVYN